MGYKTGDNLTESVKYNRADNDKNFENMFDIIRGAK